MADIAVGIDLGTSNSCISAVVDGKPMVIPNEWGEMTHASVVSFLDNGTVLVGNAAKRNIAANSQNTVYSVKRLIGRFFASEEVTNAQALLPYRIVEGPNNSVLIAIQDKTFSMAEIAALVLKELKEVAEDYFGQPVEKAVITVPAYFNDNSRQATKNAGRIAGFEVLRIINEPTAAALAYGFGRDISQRVVVYDLGGGTFDVSVLEIGKDVFEVLATAGDTYLGGDDFDNRIISWLADNFLSQTNIDLRQSKECMQTLKTAAEQAKIDISQHGVATVNCPAICQNTDGIVLDLQQTLTQDILDTIVLDLVQRSFKVCDEALRGAQMTIANVDAVVMVGGSTKLSIIRDSVRHFFKKMPKADVDPDQVVSLGAALQAHALVGSSTETFLIDVTPLSLRIGTVGGYTEKIIEKNTPIPIEQSKMFTTTRDGQDKVKIRVYQGEENKASECELLGEFEFSSFRIGYRGDVTINVTFAIDSNGIVNVSATDHETGQRTSMTINLSLGPSEAVIQESIAANKSTTLTRQRNAP